jgi:phage FluMu protein Com
MMSSLIKDIKIRCPNCGTIDEIKVRHVREHLLKCGIGKYINKCSRCKMTYVEIEYRSEKSE